MANPRTLHDAAFQVFVDVLMADPSLATRVRTWRRWSTDPKDDGAAEIAPALCPIAWLSPTGTGSSATRIGGDGLLQEYALPIGVEVETWVTARPGVGLHRSDALDLSALIYGALWPEDRTARTAIDARFRAVGVVDVILRRSILPEVYNDLFIGSSGLIELDQRAIL